MKKLFLCSLCALSMVAMAGDPALHKAIDGAQRTQEEKARDAHRHPAQTLAFFGIKPNMTVAEIWPGGGWYTQILAPYLKDKGHYIAAGYDQNPSGQYKDYLTKANKAFKEKFVDHPDTYGSFKVGELAPPAKVTIAPEGTVDMVLTFRNLHNWIPSGDTEIILSSIHKALKPGGILGVIDHRGNPAVKTEKEGTNGYVHEGYAIKVIEAAGFKLAGKSDVNNNPKDKADHPQGVWTLPPTMAMGKEKADEYKAIGESDRFTLKFIKK